MNEKRTTRRRAWNGEETRAHAMFALLVLVEDFFVVIFAGDFFFFAPPLLVYFISVFC